MAEEKPEEKSSIGDILGIKPFGNAVEKVTDAGIEVTKELIERICYPVATEVGLFFKDWMAWRRINLNNTCGKASKLIPKNSSLQAHPRILHEIIEKASWVDDEELQAMWAGLLASSCTEDGKNERNIVFINILSQLSPTDVKLLNRVIERVILNGNIGSNFPHERVEGIQLRLPLYKTENEEIPSGARWTFGIDIDTLNISNDEIFESLRHLKLINLINISTFQNTDIWYELNQRNVLELYILNLSLELYRVCQCFTNSSTRSIDNN